jgi:hypothetical protein
MMHRSSKQKLFALAAVVAILVGGTLAAMTAGKGAAREKRGPLVTAASYLGISTSQLHNELQSGRSLAQLANATSGKSSAGLQALLLANGKEKLASAQAKLPKRISTLLNRVTVPGQRAAAAAYLGLSRAQLASELRSGKTLAQIASAIPGKSVSGLIEAIVAARRTLLEARVAAGTLTQAQANARLAHLTSRVTTAVSRLSARPRG